jgi:hypothetical protein
MILCEWDAVEGHDRRFWLAYPSDRRGFAGPKKKTIVSLVLFNPLWCRLTSVYFRDNQYFLYGSAEAKNNDKIYVSFCLSFQQDNKSYVYDFRLTLDKIR